MVTAGLAAVFLAGVTSLWTAARDWGDAERSPKPTTTVAKAKPRSVPPPTTRAPGTTAPPKSGPIHAATIAASSQSGNGQNGCGQVTNYNPSNVQDGDPSTAWRTFGDGTGQTLTLNLPGPTHLTQVGLVPGYTRIDPCTHVNRFDQMRKVTQVQWVFDGGKTVNETFLAQPQMQMMPVDVVTTTVTIEISGTTPPNGLDYTPISEVSLLGYAATR
jgi:hypothetical protein